MNYKKFIGRYRVTRIMVILLVFSCYGANNVYSMWVQAIEEFANEGPECNENDCHICFEPVDPRDYEYLNCCASSGKKYHSECLNEWLSKDRRCPYCNADASMPAIHFKDAGSSTACRIRCSLY